MSVDNFYEPLKKDVNYENTKVMGNSHEEILPFCEKLVLASVRSKMKGVIRKDATYAPYEAIE